jgi:Replication-relaxation
MSELVCPNCELHWNPADQKSVPRRVALQRYEKLPKVQRRVLWSLYYLGVMSQSQVGRLISDSTSAKRRSNHATAVLTALTGAGLIERHKFGSENFVTLTDHGTYVCATERGVKVAKAKQAKSDLIGRGYWKHRLGIGDIAISFLVAQRRGLGELGTWITDDIRYSFVYLGSQRPLAPDAYGEWSAGSSNLYQFWVEFERAKYDRQQITDKIWRYTAQLKAWQNHYPCNVNAAVARIRETFPVVLYVAESKNQLPTITRSVRDGVGEIIPLDLAADKIVFGLALRSDVVEQTPLGKIWTAPVQGATGLTLTDLYRFTRGSGCVATN